MCVGLAEVHWGGLTVTTDGNIGIELIGSNGRYLLLDYLGGGQTAGVYRARVLPTQRSERLPELVAVKLMAPDLDAKTRIRFLQEVDILTELQRAETGLRELWEIKEPGPSAVPTVWDEQRAGVAPFFVMTLAEGEPLDEILRRQRRLPEAQALNLARQIAEIFVALHEGLNRSYLDFQPRNFFWQAETERLMVIDWNLLSPKGQADVAGDLAQLAGLLRRMLTGGEAQTNGRAGSVETKEWGEISRGARNILRRALDPRPALRYGTADELRIALQRQFGFWQRYGDDLLVDAGALERQSSQASQAGEAGRARDLLEEAWVLFDMALRRGISSNQVIQKVREGLQGRLEAQARAMAPLQTGRMLLDGRDYAKALEMFSDALAEARQPGQRLAAQRWLALGEAARRDYIGYGAVRDKLGPLLQSFEETAWAENDWSVILERLKEVGTWDGVSTVLAEVAAYADLQAGLVAPNRLDAPFGGAGFLAGLAQIGHNITEVKDRLASLSAGAAALDALSSTDEGPSYRSDAWAFIGDGDAVKGRRLVDDIVGRLSHTQSRLEDLQKRLAELQAQLTGPQSAAAWHELLADFGSEPLVSRGCLDTCWAWLGRRDDAASLKLVHAFLESGGGDEILRDEAARVIQLVAAFRRSDALLSVLTTLYQAQAKMQGRALTLGEVQVAETPATGEAEETGGASDLLPAASEAEAEAAQPVLLSELAGTTEPLAHAHGFDDVEHPSAAVYGVEQQAADVEAIRSVEIETVRLGDAGQITLAMADALTKIFEQLPAPQNMPVGLLQRAVAQFEQLADSAVRTRQGILSAEALIGSLAKTGAVGHEVTQAWRWRLAQAQKDQDLSETATRRYSELESELAAKRKAVESELATIRAESNQLAETQAQLSAQAEQAQKELEAAYRARATVAAEAEAERHCLLEEARAQAQVEHEIIRQALEDTLEERKRQLETLEVEIAGQTAMFEAREQDAKRDIEARIQSQQLLYGKQQDELNKIAQEIRLQTAELNRLRAESAPTQQPASAGRVYVEISGWKNIALAAKLMLDSGPNQIKEVRRFIEQAEKDSTNANRGDLKQAVSEWTVYLDRLTREGRQERTSDVGHIAEVWRLVAQAWQCLEAKDERTLGELKEPMLQAYEWAKTQADDEEREKLPRMIASWLQGATERGALPGDRPKWAEYQEAIGRALQLFIEGGTINDCTSIIKHIQSLTRSAPQPVNNLLTRCSDLLDEWRSNANRLLAEWNGQIKNSPLKDVQNTITSLARVGVKGEKKPGDILAATAKAVQDRFNAEHKEYKRTQNPTRGTMGRSATSIREEMNRLIAFQETLFGMSREIVQGGETEIAEQLDWMKEIRSNLDYQR